MPVCKHPITPEMLTDYTLPPSYIIQTISGLIEGTHVPETAQTLRKMISNHASNDGEADTGTILPLPLVAPHPDNVWQFVLLSQVTRACRGLWRVSKHFATKIRGIVQKEIKADNVEIIRKAAFFYRQIEQKEGPQAAYLTKAYCDTLDNFLASPVLIRQSEEEIATDKEAPQAAPLEKKARQEPSNAGIEDLLRIEGMGEQILRFL